MGNGVIKPDVIFLSIFNNLQLGLTLKRRIRVRDRDRSEDKILDSYLTDAFIGVLVADEIKALSGALRLTVEDTVTQILPRAAARSIILVKGAQTASACRCSSGTIYFGCQMEFQANNENYFISSELVALSNALSNGETDIRAFISSHPISMQSLRFINEWHLADHILVDYPGVKAKSLQALLPQDYELIYQKPDKSMGVKSEKAFNDHQTIRETAGFAYNRSHGPYTNFKSGLAIEGKYQKMFCGSYIETVADQPGINPLCLALSNMVVADQSYSDIKQVQLMIQPSNNEAAIDQTKAILKSVSDIRLDIEVLD